MTHRLVIRVTAAKPSHRGERAEPGAGRREQHINRVLGVAITAKAESMYQMALQFAAITRRRPLTAALKKT